MRDARPPRDHMPMTSHRSKHVFSIIAGPVSFRFAQGWTQYIDAIVGILTRTVTSASNSAGCTPSCPKTALDEPARIGENLAIRVISTRYCVALAAAPRAQLAKATWNRPKARAARLPAPAHRSITRHGARLSSPARAVRRPEIGTHRKSRSVSLKQAISQARRQSSYCRFLIIPITFSLKGHRKCRSSTARSNRSRQPHITTAISFPSAKNR
ncbi:hypothetical protein [Burkholderia gladioli]|uniref:hypothetical protein n=1 Tax=Burkholderia gladioli TaxID=28095 RepID=UPI000B0BCB2F|nr:hypothetical protein [Burkholderia gladioli]